MAHDQFADQSPGDGVAMQHGMTVAHAPCLEGMAKGVAQVEGLAQTFLVRILSHHLLLDLHAGFKQGEERLGVPMFDVVIEQVVEMLLVAQQSVFQHFGITREQIHVVECLEELGRDQYCIGGCKGTYLIFQRTQVHTRLATHGCIDGTQ